MPRTTVYIVDTWVDVAHPEFEGRARIGAQFSTGRHELHGTHVAGLVGGKTVGVNPNALLVAVQVLDASGWGTWGTITRGLEWVAQQPVKGIVNLSIGGPGSAVVDRAIELMAQRGFKIVVAAGNDAADACFTSPSRSPSALSVGATTIQDTLATFSNHGKCVALLAPGDDIRSSVAGNKYALMSGTSMAAPIVAGIWSAYPQRTRQDMLSISLRGAIVEPLPALTPNKFALMRRGLTC